MAPEEIILVDEADQTIGYEEKLSAHQNGGKLHRAFSIFLFNTRGQMLLQLRSTEKYHFGGLWTNTCCSHPRRGEETADAARRRLQEELGIDCELREVGTFTYTATDSNSGLTEREFDHVYEGDYEGAPQPQPGEIDEVKWASPEEIQRDLAAHPERYTPWFPLALAQIMSQRD